MNQLLGIRNLNSNISVESLKRDLLIFDKMVIVGIPERDHVFYPNKDCMSSNESELLGLKFKFAAKRGR